MGAWGTSLYANDSASDIRGDYLDRLRRGKTNEEVTEELIHENRGIMGDEEEEPLFWFALADTQWNYGRLLPFVKEKALYFLSQDAELERWRESGEKQLAAWMKTLDALRTKLNSPQPPEKKVYRYRLHRCEWQFGDVFAYRFTSEFSREHGFFGKYMVFRKVSETNCWPGHIIPVVIAYRWMGDCPPSLEEVKCMELLPVLYSWRRKVPNRWCKYNFAIHATSKRSLPKESLIYMGNIAGDDFIPFSACGGNDYASSAGWEGSSYNQTIEPFLIDRYLHPEKYLE